MSTSATATPSESSTTPSVLTALGLGNSAPSVTPEEVGHVPASQTVEPVVAPAVAAAPEPKAESKDTTAPAETKPAEPEADHAQKELTRLNKQLKDTRDAYTRERQVNVETQRKIDSLTKQIEVLGKKFDGTFDEQKDAPRALSPAEILAEADRTATVRASQFAAVEYLMAKDGLTKDQAILKIERTVWDQDAPFQELNKDPAIAARVMNSQLPIIEAMKVVSEHEAKAKYGDNPEAMRKAIEAELTPRLKKEAREEILKEMKSKGVAFDTIKGLGGVASVTPGTPDEKPRLVFDSLFPGFSKTAS